LSLPAIASGVHHGGSMLLAQHQHEHEDDHMHGAAAEGDDERAMGHSHEMSQVHGGQVFMTKAHHFEVLFVPEGVRIYPYGADQQPRSAEGLSGTAEIRRKGMKETASMDLAAVSPEGENARSFLRGDWDHSKVKPGDAKLTFTINDPALKEEPEATFTATFDGPTPTVRYHCPMAEHTPDGMMDPGKCPKCGMALEKKTMGDDHGHHEGNGDHEHEDG
jgi:hypothetical protein